MSELDKGLLIIASTVSPNQSFSVGVSGTGSTRTITINANATGVWRFRIELVDLNTSPNVRTLVAPEPLQQKIFERYTEPTGILTLDIEHTGDAHTWYPLVTCLGKTDNDASNALIFS